MTIRISFVQLLPEDIPRVGFDGAAVLALIRFVTAVDDAREGRVVIDGETWWRTSHGKIGDLLGGVSDDRIRRIVSKLQKAGELTVVDPKDSYDRTQLYRVPDQSFRDIAEPLISHSVESRNAYRGIAESTPRNRGMHTAESRNVLSTQELEEELLEESEKAAPSADPAHSDLPASLPGATSEEQTVGAELVGAKSPNGVVAKKTAGKGRRTAASIPEDFSVPDFEIEEILERFPRSTRDAVRRQTFKFVNHYLGSGAVRADWLAGWRKWMADADDRGDFTTNGNSHNAKVADYGTAAQSALRLLANQAAVNGSTPKELP